MVNLRRNCTIALIAKLAAQADAKLELQSISSEKDTVITSLQSKLAGVETEKKLAVSDALKEKKREMNSRLS